MTNPIATYTFLPWLRQGITGQITQVDTFGPGLNAERASVRISLQVNNQADFVASDVHLLGPGDVVGIQPHAVVRTEPRDRTTNFEPNYLAAIDFYDEDFPWRYTPASAIQVPDGSGQASPSRSRLRPWIFLIVLEASEFTDDGLSGRPLPSITLTGATDGIFPPADQTWAWAHVHISTDIANGSDIAHTLEALKNLLQANPDTALSRLICPRRLKGNAAYHAFLIPAFEIGRLAGLGQSMQNPDALTPSWGGGQTQYPVYYRWSFRTADGGDFKYLVGLLKPGPVDSSVGIRDMDMQAPGFGVPGMSHQPGDSIVMGLEGALKSPMNQPNPTDWPPESPTPQPAFLNGLAAIVNLQDDLLQPPSGDGTHPDPVISPPLYGRWHALQKRLQVGTPGWVNELNEDPRLRVPAGLGTQVIQANQENYMRKAWQQVGDVLEANQRIRQFQVSILAGAQVFQRSFLTLDADQKLALTAQVHSRVLGSPTTIAYQVKTSRLPGAALQPAFRRITRPRGPLMRRAVPPATGKPANMLTRLNSEDNFTAAPPKQAPTKAIPLQKLLQSLDTQIAPHPGTGLNALKGSIFEVDKIQPRPGFVLTMPGESLPSGIGKTGTSDSSNGLLFRRAMLDLSAQLQIDVPAPPVGQPLDFGQATAILEGALNPAQAIPQRALKVLAIPTGYRYVKPVVTIAPVMAHPVIDEPMYRPLNALSSELLIPNLDKITKNTITLLETNPRFIEAYIAGLNHEFARELLWREYPTDLRPSTFLLFWEPAEKASRDSQVDPATRAIQQRDFIPLHEWDPHSTLGSHANKPLPTGEEGKLPPAPGSAQQEDQLVLAVRGDVLQRYPTAVIYAQKAKWQGQVRVLDDSDPLEPIFKAEILPDLRFFGFNLTNSQAKGSTKPADKAPGYFFVIHERPGEPRFGLDVADSPNPADPSHWSELTWDHLAQPDPVTFIELDPGKAPKTNNITDDPSNIMDAHDTAVHWGANAADMAYILFREPVMVAVHAESMLP